MQNENAKLKIKFQGLFLFFLVFSFCILNFAPRTASADPNPNFQIEIFYAKEVEKIDTTEPSTVTIINPNNSSFVINLPSDALASGEDVELTAYSIPEEAITPDNPLPSGKLGSDIFYNISFIKIGNSSLVSSFDKPVILNFFYTDSDISGINEDTLKVYRWNGREWSVLSDSSVDASLNKITATTEQFSNFSLLGDPFSVSSENSGGGGRGNTGKDKYVAPVTGITVDNQAYPENKATLPKKETQIVSTVVTDTNTSFPLESEIAAKGKDQNNNEEGIVAIPPWKSSPREKDYLVPVILAITAVICVTCKILWKKSPSLKIRRIIKR